MAHEVVMPRLGWNMETGRVGEWRKRDGEMVAAGDILFTVEGDKATQEVEALDSGVLHLPPDSPPPGTDVAVGTVLGYLLAPGETPPTAAGAVAASPASTMSAPVAPARRDAAARPGPRQKGPTISPRARRAAQALGVDWTQLHGSGRTGRIVERDVQAAAAQAQRVVPVAAAPALAPGTARPVSPMRQLIAGRMAASAHTAAPVTLTTEADATELVRLRRQLQAEGTDPLPTYTDLLAKVVAAALQEHPALNTRFEGDAIVQAATVNVGVAVDTERGLLVPVLRDVQAKTLRQVAQESAALVARARDGALTAAEMQSGTFTVTNLGMYGIDAFTPIINLPECAVLGVGRIAPKQVVTDAEAGQVAIRQMVFLSLTFDHRLVDGAPAARFLQRVTQLVAKPYLWLWD